MTEFRHGLRLDLADAFPRDVEVLSEFFERLGFVTSEAEAQDKDVALALMERGQRNVKMDPVVVLFRFEEAPL